MVVFLIVAQGCRVALSEGCWKQCKNGRKFPYLVGKKSTIRFFPIHPIGAMTKKILFLKNKAGELLKTKGNSKKQTENKPETKLTILLKTIEGPKKQTENKPKNKAGHGVENKGSLKNRPKTNPRTESSMIALKRRPQDPGRSQVM